MKKDGNKKMREWDWEKQKVCYIKKKMIFIQPILYNLCDNHFFSIFIGQKQ